MPFSANARAQMYAEKTGWVKTIHETRYGELLGFAAPLLLISQLALHTKNILVDPRVSLMLDERKEGDPLQGARVMLMGLAAKTESADARRRYLAHQPEAEMFAGFGDFAFYEVKLKGAHLVAGFGRIVDLKPDQLLTDLIGAEALVAAEPEVIAHMNADHAETCRLYATKLRDAPDGDWRCVGCDPEGLDLQCERLGPAAVPTARHPAWRAARRAQADGRSRRGRLIAVVLHTMRYG
jgi:putative heme iron utilization protein